MTAHTEIKRVGVIGSGTIGASWALFFMARGLDVTVYDLAPSQEAFVKSYLEANWPTAIDLGLTSRGTPPSFRFATDLANAVADVDFVQENAPDDLAVKQRLYRELDAVTPPHVCIASSTSSLKISDLQQGLEHERRFVAAHPFNPPHLLPLVEIVGGERTAPEVVALAADFFRGLGKVVLRLEKEIVGHVANRLQGALFREALWLVREGIIDVAGIDNAISFGPGLRWAVFGPILSFHLAAQNGGIRQYLASLGPAQQRIWDDLQPLDGGISPALVDQVAEGVAAEVSGASVAELIALRDSRMISIVRDALLSARDRGVVGNSVPATGADINS